MQAVRLRLLLVCVLAPLVLWAALPVLSQGETKAGSAQLQTKIDVTRGKISTRKSKEHVLAQDITRYNSRIETLQQRIDRIAARQAVVQRDLDVKSAELATLQQDLRAERQRLTRLRLRLKEARQILGYRLRELYQADKPDIVTVVLNARGFADLIERTQFLSRIQAQDQLVVTRVRTAQRDAIATEARLNGLERRQATVTARITARRDEIAQLKRGVISTRVVYDNAKSEKSSALQLVRGERKDLEGNLQALEKEQAKVKAKLAKQMGLPGSFTGTGGQLSMPVNGVFTSPFGYRWGRLHAGIDIGATEGTPIHAADSGRVVLMGPTGGYGNYTCIQHSASLSTCYAHQSRFGTTMGANVRRGQVIGYVGNTGHSFGAHLHFEVRINGNPVNPVPYL
ncbi:MAG: peptidoglycan DD-metalloendopeptidase family protein [Solirubrobacterales bacterium]|nr:peptidoglycan DD-metalloendopeptidase family protein [Solirubrobacterales bacterium]